MKSIEINLALTKDKADKLRAAIKKNGGYCLCSLVKDENHICGPCKDFLNDGQLDNNCHCGLYHKKIVKE